MDMCMPSFRSKPGVPAGRGTFLMLLLQSPIRNVDHVAGPYQTLRHGPGYLPGNEYRKSLRSVTWFPIATTVPNYSSQKVLVASLCVAIVFVSIRCVARWYKTRGLPMAAEDIFMYLAVFSFAITCALYLAAMPTFYNVMDITTGKMAPYASLQTDLVRMLKEFFAVQMFFWFTLFCVKWSLLFMFKALTNGIRLYTNIWWAALAFTVLTFIGCVISGITSCSSMEAWFTAGLCDTPRDARAKAISLWYCMAVDVLGDLLIMVIPIRVLISLRITFVQKFSIGVVFVVGIITMVFAIVRVVSLNDSVNGGQVSTQWLMLWAGIEGAVAIIVGCLPPFAIFLRGRVEDSRVQYNNPYPANTSSKGSNALSHIQHSRIKSAARNESLMLEDLESNGSGQDNGSRKSLVGDGITVTQAWSQKSYREVGMDRERERRQKMGLNGAV
ncbi:hypothetical protein V492_00032 [Pseudogymnoascus sp. VKM F-4246]|nr:hypothetical protein V492_00032 [Pseudogymnoascus sp. VKM F-4246]